MRPVGDHFYTTSLPERDNAVHNLGYTDEGIAGWVLTAPAATSRIPLYRLWSAAVSDHFYTISGAERDHAASLGYAYEGIACDVLPVGDTDGIQLYRVYHPESDDHFYTVSASERDNAVQNLGYQDEGVACHVPPSSAAGAAALYRLFHPGASEFLPDPRLRMLASRILER